MTLFIVILFFAICDFAESLNGHKKSLSRRSTVKSCSGESCIKFLDDIVYALEEPSTHKYPPLPGSSKGLRAITCRQGSQTCDLEFDDETATGLPSTSFRELDATIGTDRLGEASWLDIATMAGTDKVSHGYAPMYQEYLGPLSRAEVDPFMFVEMGYAGGASARAWRKFFPKADLHEMELSCDGVPYKNKNRSNWEHRILAKPQEEGIHLHCGDAREKEFIDQSLETSRPLVFIDDGGHGPDDMIKPFHNVFPKLQDGGYYFVEDLGQAYHMQVHFPEQVLKPIVRDLMAPAGVPHLVPEISDQIDHVKCRLQICVIVKKGGKPIQQFSKA